MPGQAGPLQGYSVQLGPSALKGMLTFAIKHEHYLYLILLYYDWAHPSIRFQ